MKLKESRTTGVIAGIMGGCAADLTTYERDPEDDVTPVRRVIVTLTADDIPHLEAAIAALRKSVPEYRQ